MGSLKATSEDGDVSALGGRLVALNHANMKADHKDRPAISASRAASSPF
jgi:hypothetical protein